MCTVIYLPIKNGYILSSTRDESIHRPKAIPPCKHTHNKTNFYCPIDPFGKGTWWATNENGTTVILLNGGFKNHIKKLNYTKSRGIIVRELITKKNIILSLKKNDLENIEPFSLIIKSHNKIIHFVWDGSNKHFMELDQKIPQIWSSSTLYPNSVKIKRTVLFQQWLLSKPTNKKNVVEFLYSYTDLKNGFIMNRKKTQTLSISILENKNEKIKITYLDIINKQQKTLSFNLNKP